MVEEALSLHKPKHVEIGCSTSDLIVLKDASVQMKRLKTKSVRTQCREEDLIESVDILKVKITKPKKSRSIAINTDLTFKPNDEQKNSDFKISKELLHTVDDEGPFQNEISDSGDDDDDDSYHPSDDSLDETDDNEDVYEEISTADLQKGTKLVVFWSCLSTFFNVCQLCYQPAKIYKIFHKGTKIIVDVVCKLKHKYTWHSQPNVNWQSSRKHFNCFINHSLWRNF